MKGVLFVNKKIKLMLLILVSLLFISSCFGNRGAILVDENRRTDNRMEEIGSAIKDKDKEALKSLFSKKALNEVNDFDNELDYFFDFIQGDVESWKRDSISSSTSYESGKTTNMIRFGFRLVTDVDKYDFFIIDYNIDTINPYNEGVYMIQLRKSSYVGSWGGSWQERMRPGFFIQEMEESDELEEAEE